MYIQENEEYVRHVMSYNQMKGAISGPIRKEE